MGEFKHEIITKEQLVMTLQEIIEGVISGDINGGMIDFDFKGLKDGEPDQCLCRGMWRVMDDEGVEQNKVIGNMIRDTKAPSRIIKPPRIDE